MKITTYKLNQKVFLNSLDLAFCYNLDVNWSIEKMKENLLKQGFILFEIFMEFITAELLSICIIYYEASDSYK